YGSEKLHALGVLEPVLVDRQAAMRAGKDDIEIVLAIRDRRQPTLIIDLDLEAQPLEMAEDAGVIPRLAEDIEVLGGTADAGIGADGIGSRDQERDLRPGELAQRLRVELLGIRTGRRGG